MLMLQMLLITNMGCYSSTHLTRMSTPRFQGKKRGKGHNGLQGSSQAHHDLLSWIDWSMTLWSFSSFLCDCFLTALKERGRNCREVDLWEDRVSHGQLMEWVLVNIFWAGKHETPESMRRNGKVSSLVRKALSTFDLYSQTIKREALDVQYGGRKGRLNSGLLSLKTWFLVSI
jgi:hypothetical protein